MFRDEQRRDKIKNSYRKFIPVRSRSLCQIDGRVGFACRVEGKSCRIGSRVFLGAFKYAHIGRGNPRCVASAENGTARDYADGRRTANAGRRSVRHMLVVVPRLRARVSPSYRSRGRTRTDNRVAYFEINVEALTAVDQGYEKELYYE